MKIESLSRCENCDVPMFGKEHVSHCLPGMKHQWKLGSDPDDLDAFNVDQSLVSQVEERTGWAVFRSFEKDKPLFIAFFASFFDASKFMKGQKDMNASPAVVARNKIRFSTHPNFVQAVDLLVEGTTLLPEETSELRYEAKKVMENQ